MESDCPPAHCCLVVVEDSSKDDLIKSLRSDAVNGQQRIQELEKTVGQNAYTSSMYEVLLQKYQALEEAYKNLEMKCQNQYSFVLPKQGKPTH